MKQKKLLALSGFLLLATINMTYADDYRDVVRSTDGQVVHVESSGTCVRTKWMNDRDVCAAGQMVAMEHTVIAKEDRTVYFGFNKADLTPEGMALLDTLAERLSSAADVEGARVVGYADRIGTVSYNDKLSKKRALAVRDYLIAHGVTNASVTKTRWVGKSEPSAKCDKDMKRVKLIDCLQPDRRVEVEIVYRAETHKPGNPNKH